MYGNGCGRGRGRLTAFWITDAPSFILPSPSPAVACLTVRIEAMRAHCAANKQDKAAKRAFTTLLTRRRNLLQYLRRKDFEAYTRTLAELKITGFS